MEREEKKTWGKRESKIIVRLLLIVVAALILMNVWEVVSPRIFKNGKQSENGLRSESIEEGGRFGSKYFQNRQIDKLEPMIKQSEKSNYTKEEIDSAVNCVKAKFKENEGNVSLLSLSFDEKESDAFRDGYYAAKDFGKRNVIVLFCDYAVYDTLKGRTENTFKNWAMILTRSGENAPWTVFDQGY